MTNFYEECSAELSYNPLHPDILKNTSVNTCFGARRCENGRFANGDSPYAGYDPFGNCTCSNDHILPTEYQTTRFKRQRRGREGSRRNRRGEPTLLCAGLDSRGNCILAVDSMEKITEMDYNSAASTASNTISRPIGTSSSAPIGTM